MLQITRHFGPLRVRETWFSTKPTVLNSLTASSYIQTQSTDFVLGFLRTVTYTKIIQLSQPATNLLKSFRKNCSYEIRRAANEGTRFEEFSDVETFIHFFNECAELHEIPKLSLNQLQTYERSLRFFRVKNQERTLVAHVYLTSSNKMRARLFFSCSSFLASERKDLRALAGRANRLLTWSAILRFKEENFAEYDFGGYPIDPLATTRQFIDSFSGEVKKETSYFSYIYVVLRWFRHLIKKDSALLANLNRLIQCGGMLYWIPDEGTARLIDFV